MLGSSEDISIEACMYRNVCIHVYSGIRTAVIITSNSGGQGRR